jgi:hypothetical protein
MKTIICDYVEKNKWDSGMIVQKYGLTPLTPLTEISTKNWICSEFVYYS